MKPYSAGPRPLHSPRIPVMIPWATPEQNKEGASAFSGQLCKVCGSALRTTTHRSVAPSAKRAEKSGLGRPAVYHIFIHHTNLLSVLLCPFNAALTLPTKVYERPNDSDLFLKSF